MHREHWAIGTSSSSMASFPLPPRHYRCGQVHVRIDKPSHQGRRDGVWGEPLQSIRAREQLCVLKGVQTILSAGQRPQPPSTPLDPPFHSTWGRSAHPSSLLKGQWFYWPSSPSSPLGGRDASLPLSFGESIKKCAVVGTGLKRPCGTMAVVLAAGGGFFFFTGPWTCCLRPCLIW